MSDNQVTPEAKAQEAQSQESQIQETVTETTAEAPVENKAPQSPRRNDRSR